jgi:hypothetical protein
MRVAFYSDLRDTGMNEQRRIFIAILALILSSYLLTLDNTCAYVGSFLALEQWSSVLRQSVTFIVRTIAPAHR